MSRLRSRIERLEQEADDLRRLEMVRNRVNEEWAARLHVPVEQVRREVRELEAIFDPKLRRWFRESGNNEERFARRIAEEMAAEVHKTPEQTYLALKDELAKIRSMMQEIDF